MPNQSEITGCENFEFQTNDTFFVNDNSDIYLDLFKSIAIKVVSRDGDIYYNIPQYFKQVKEGLFEVLNNEQLPEDVQEMVESEEVTQLKKELVLTEQLWEDTKKVLEAIPECSTHGNHCIPHAIEWIEEKKNTYCD